MMHRSIFYSTYSPGPRPAARAPRGGGRGAAALFQLPLRRAARGVGGARAVLLPIIHSHSHKQAGFTLIELIVSLGIFSMVMLIATGSYLSAVSTTKNVQESTKAVNTIAAALNTISNEIRNGSCGAGQCATGAHSQFSFTNSSGTDVTYCLTGGVIERVEGTTLCSSAGADKQITDASVKVTNLSFWNTAYSSTVAGITGKQYFVVITLSGKSLAAGSTAAPIYLETGVTFRQLTVSS